jgi:valyl-tRNA synthetase
MNLSRYAFYPFVASALLFLQLTGKESLADKWILTKLNKAVTEANLYFDQMNFMACTSSIYNFWLYELCDVYLESIKPVMDAKEDDKEGMASKRSAQATLYTCLENGLKMLHPLMPFITEELYQRLPRRPNDTAESIMIASYPEERPDWNHPESESDYDIILSIVRAARSLLADYNIKSNAKLYVQANDNEMKSLSERESQTFQTLIKGVETVTIVTSEKDIPVGCAATTISTRCNVYLMVKVSLGQVSCM